MYVQYVDNHYICLYLIFQLFGNICFVCNNVVQGDGKLDLKLL